MGTLPHPHRTVALTPWAGCPLPASLPSLEGTDWAACVPVSPRASSSWGCTAGTCAEACPVAPEALGRGLSRSWQQRSGRREEVGALTVALWGAPGPSSAGWSGRGPPCGHRAPDSLCRPRMGVGAGWCVWATGCFPRGERRQLWAKLGRGPLPRGCPAPGPPAPRSLCPLPLRVCFSLERTRLAQALRRDCPEWRLASDPASQVPFVPGVLGGFSPVWEALTSSPRGMFWRG